jgi:hypothetical protein
MEYQEKLSNVYLAVSLDIPFLIARSVFSNVYLPVSLEPNKRERKPNGQSRMEYQEKLQINVRENRTGNHEWNIKRNWQINVREVFSNVCLPVSLDFPFLIALSVFCNVYFASFFGYFILDCPFCFL